MPFALNLPAVFATLLVPPVIIGVAGGLAARRRPILGPATGLVIGLFALWSLYEFAWLWQASAEVWPFRHLVMAAIGCGSVGGISVLVWLARQRPSRPAA